MLRSTGKPLGKDEEDVTRLLKSPLPYVRDLARKKLIESNTRLVVSVAKKYQHRGLPLEELIQEGNIGLMSAVDKFDPKKETKFSTHATYWIKQRLGRAIEEQGKHIRIPANAQWELNKLRKFKNNWRVERGREPTSEETFKYTGIPDNRQANLEMYEHKIRSTSVPIYNSEGGKQITLGETLESPQYGQHVALQPEQDEGFGLSPQAEKRFGEHVLHAKALIYSQLDKREQEMLLDHYGIGTDKSLSLSQVAKKYGVAKSRAHQIVQGAIMKLQNPDVNKVTGLKKKIKSGEL